MTTAELQVLLSQEGFNPRDYSLAGGNASDTYCLAHECGAWVVYYTERGVRSDVRRHLTEHGACLDLLNRLRELWTWMARNAARGGRDQSAGNA